MGREEWKPWKVPAASGVVAATALTNVAFQGCVPFSVCIGAKLPLYAFKKLNVNDGDIGLLGHEKREPPVAFLDSLLLREWEDRMQRGLFRYDVTACETKVIPGQFGFIAQLNEGCHLKKRPIEFRVDKVLQPFDGSRFNFTKVEQEEVLFQFEANEDGEAQ